MPSSPANANGWYRTAVTIPYSIVDPNADTGASPSGLAPEVNPSGTLTFDADGQNMKQTVDATDVAGNVTHTNSPGINIDRVAPEITATVSSAPNAAGWFRGDVTVTFACSDALSGVDSCSSPVVLNGEGVGLAASGKATDRAGNDATAAVAGINIDRTAPVIAAPASVAVDAVNTSSAAVSFAVTASDAGSGAPAPVCAPASGSMFPVGTTTVTCAVTDAAGNRAEASFPVVVRFVDTIAPVVTLSNNAGTYTVDQTIDIRCTATDSGSGLASPDCSGASGPAYTFAIGSNVLTSTATDRAGNVGSATTTFIVVASPSSIQSVVSLLSTNASVTNGLNAKLAAAAAAPNANARDGQLRAFENQVRAQTGKALTAEHAATILRLAAALY
jgi:hypothetical protein